MVRWIRSTQSSRQSGAFPFELSVRSSKFKVISVFSNKNCIKLLLYCIHICTIIWDLLSISGDDRGDPGLSR